MVKGEGRSARFRQESEDELMNAPERRTSDEALHHLDREHAASLNCAPERLHVDAFGNRQGVLHLNAQVPHCPVAAPEGGRRSSVAFAPWLNLGSTRSPARETSKLTAILCSGENCW